MVVSFYVLDSQLVQGVTHLAQWLLGYAETPPNDRYKINGINLAKQDFLKLVHWYIEPWEFNTDTVTRTVTPFLDQV